MLSGLRVLAILGCAILALPAPALAQSDELARAVKATFLYKFAPFVAWPEEAATALDQPSTFDICVVGDDPFGAVLDEAAAGQRVRTQPVRIRRFPSVKGGAGGCEIMYVAGSAIQSVDAALREVKGLPTLTVTDGGRSARSAGIVHFVQQEGRIRFRIDNVMAAESGLLISSQLLDLAVSVRTRSDASAVR